MDENLWTFVGKWNKIIYRSAGVPIKSSITAETLWADFRIKSAPKFPQECWYHVPEKWVDEVREMITTMQREIGNKVEFKQIKEKLCHLTVYFDTADKHARQRMYELIEECTKKLIEKGVHPPKEKDND